MNNLQEKLVGSSYLIGVEEPRKSGQPMRNITLLALMDECGVFSEWDKKHIINRINNLSIVWYEANDEINVDHIYDYDTGEIYWDNDTACADWTDGDDKLVSSLLMWGSLDWVQ